MQRWCRLHVTSCKDPERRSSPAHSYSGAANVDAGKLLVNGNQSLATGLTTVGSGVVLGASVVVNDGGTLAPRKSPGTLTINGDLSLTAASFVDFEFGQANVAGGALNDLVDIGGNLVLDGTLNVSVSSGGSFGAGI
jgi:fibronectin-binding autotransporter adhesin